MTTATTPPVPAKKFKRGKIYNLALNEIVVSGNQPRWSLDLAAMAEMTASVRKVGILEPIILRQDEAWQNIVVAGERRFEAARQAGLLTIPAIFVSGNYREIALIENMLRQDLTAIEEAEGLQALMVEQHYNQEELSEIIGKAQNSLSETLSLNKLPQVVRDDLRGDRAAAKRNLIAIAKKKDPEAMIAAYQAYKAKLVRAAPRPQKKDPNDPQTVSSLLLRAGRKIASLDTSAWTTADRDNIQATLTQIRQGIDNYFNPPPK